MEDAVGVVEGRWCRVVAEMISIGMPVDHNRDEIRWTWNLRRVGNVNIQHPGDPRYHLAPRMVYFDGVVRLRDGVSIWRSTLPTLAPPDENEMQWFLITMRLGSDLAIICSFTSPRGFITLDYIKRVL